LANETLYPVFDIPSIRTQIDAEQVFKPAPYFDFETGDFLRDSTGHVLMADGYQSYKIWVLKALKTQLDACLCYLDFGIDLEGAFAETARKASESVLERTITEALLINPGTERIYEFAFVWAADTVEVSFVVKPRNWAAFDINFNVASRR